jgi:hypothetical protein
MIYPDIEEKRDKNKIAASSCFSSFSNKQQLLIVYLL